MMDDNERLARCNCLWTNARRVNVSRNVIPIGSSFFDSVLDYKDIPIFTWDLPRCINTPGKFCEVASKCRTLSHWMYLMLRVRFCDCALNIEQRQLVLGILLHSMIVAHEDVRRSASVFMDAMKMTPFLPYVVDVSKEGDVSYPSVDYCELETRFQDCVSGRTYARDSVGTVYVGSCYQF